MKSQILFDIGGTNVRTAILENNEIKYLNKEAHNFISMDDILNYLNSYITNAKNIETKVLIVAIAAIVENNHIVSSTNLPFLNNQTFPQTFSGFNLTLINDADAAILGEMMYHKIDTNKNILSLIFGTGVGSGIWINNNLVLNSEVDDLFEKYLCGKTFDRDDLSKMYRKFSKNLARVVELMNIDVVVINGFINNYDIFKNITEDINVRPYFKDKLTIIFSECKEPVIYGCSADFY
jgi:predicted NBD/HSP70 family sugar kinase